MGDVRRPDVRVTMIDNDLVFVDSALRYCAQYEPRLVVTALAGTHALTRYPGRLRSDVVTVDPDQFEDVVGVVAALRTTHARTRVVVLTMCSDTSVAVALARAGALGWVGKDEPITALVETIDTVCGGAARYPPRHLAGVLQVLTDQSRCECQRHRTGAALSKRERQVLGRMLAGASSGDIARELQLSPNTVRSHRRRIGSKLGVGR